MFCLGLFFAFRKVCALAQSITFSGFLDSDSDVDSGYFYFVNR